MAPQARARDRSPARWASPLAVLLATLLLSTVAACALKKPPDAAAIKAEALPTTEVPGAWTARGAGAGAVSDNWLTTFRDDQLTAAVAEAIGHNADLRVAAARVLGEDVDGGIRSG